MSTPTSLGTLRQAIRRTAVTVALTVTALLAGLGGGAAAPPTEYSAEQTTQIGAMTIVSKIYVQGEKTRNETRGGTQNAVTIMRRDKGRVWVLWPAMRVYVDQAISAADPRLERDPNAKEERELVGHERVGPYETDRFRVTSKNLRGEPIEYYEWHAKTLGGLVVRRKSDYGQVELQKVVIARQPPELFEVPPDFRKLSVGAPSPPSK